MATKVGKILDTTRPPLTRVDYDNAADVLYVSIGEPVAGYVDDDEDGLLFRRAEADEHPCGVTVLGFREAHWSERLPQLAERLTRFLGVDTASLTFRIEQATHLGDARR